MLRALYDFKATYAKTLSFKTHDYFILHQTNTRHKNWWQVINEKGEVGFIPSNYVETVTVYPTFYLHFLDSCTSYAKNYDIAPEFLITNKEELLERLKEMKRQLYELPEVKEALGSEQELPPLLFRNEYGELETIKGEKVNSFSDLEEPFKPSKNHGSSKESLHKSIEDVHEEILKEKLNDENNRRHSKSNSASSPLHSTHPQSTKVSPTITQQAVYELVENVRINTQLSHELSRIAVGTVIQGLHDLLPANVFPYLSTIMTHVDSCLAVDNVQINQTHDASRLKVIFDELTSCKEDSQQRSWMLHEDEGVITDYLSELLSILVGRLKRQFSYECYIIYIFYASTYV